MFSSLVVLLHVAASALLFGSTFAQSESALRVQTNFTLVAATAAAESPLDPGLACPRSVVYLRILNYQDVDDARPGAIVDAIQYRYVIVDGNSCRDTGTREFLTVFQDVPQSPLGTFDETAEIFFLRGRDNSPRQCGTSFAALHPNFYYFTDDMPRFRSRLERDRLIPTNSAALASARASEIYMIAQPFQIDSPDGSVVFTAVCTFRAGTPVLIGPEPNGPGATSEPESDDVGSRSGTESAVCFPAAAAVTVIDIDRPAPLGAHSASFTRTPHHRRIRMDELQVGARVLSGPHGVSSPVYLFSHRERDVIATFVRISVGRGNATSTATLTLSPGHYLPTRPRGLLPARDVRPGSDAVQLAGDGGRWLVVSQVQRVRARGVYAPHTLNGELVVDGVVVSTYTTVCVPRLAHALLAPARAAYMLGGWHLGGLLDKGLDSWILRPVRWVLELLPQLTDVQVGVGGRVLDAVLGRRSSVGRAISEDL